MNKYIFDQAWEQERERLANLEGWLDPGTVRHLETIGVAPGWRCLEVGGGGGSITTWLSERVGKDGAVVATDLDTRFLDALDLPNVEVRRHDIVADELPKDEFELVHARCLVEHLAQPEEALRRMYETLKPGGWLLVEDIDFITHRAVTPSDAYERVREAFEAAMSMSNFKPSFGRRLPGLLSGLGLRDLSAEGRIPFGSLADRGSNAGMTNYKLSLGFLREPMIASGAVTAEDIDEAVRLLDDDSFELMPPSIIAAWGRKP